MLFNITCNIFNILQFGHSISGDNLYTKIFQSEFLNSKFLSILDNSTNKAINNNSKKPKINVMCEVFQAAFDSLCGRVAFALQSLRSKINIVLFTPQDKRKKGFFRSF